MVVAELAERGLPDLMNNLLLTVEKTEIYKSSI